MPLFRHGRLNAAPQPERNLKDLRSSIAQEVFRSDEDMDTLPGMMDNRPGAYKVLPVESWRTTNPKETGFSRDFMRARTILQAITYGHKYWQMEYGLHIQLDRQFLHEHPGVIAGTQRLFQLVILSRTPVVARDERWSLPVRRDVYATQGKLREELGVSEAYDAQDHTIMGEVVDFPTVDYDKLVGSILSGVATLGNPEQPTVECWKL